MIRNLSKVIICSLFVEAPKLEGCITRNFLGFLYFFVFYKNSLYDFKHADIVGWIVSLICKFRRLLLQIYAKEVSYGHIILGANW